MKSEMQLKFLEDHIGSDKIGKMTENIKYYNYYAFSVETVFLHFTALLELPYLAY